jgi:hypothetical protein
MLKSEESVTERQSNIKWMCNPESNSFSDYENSSENWDIKRVFVWEYGHNM